MVSYNGVIMKRLRFKGDGVSSDASINKDNKDGLVPAEYVLLLHLLNLA